MTPVELLTPRLLLDQPTVRDIAAIREYCQDPLFEQALTTPWPYQQRHARAFVMEHVQESWAKETEFTWALRTAPGGQLLGVVSNAASAAVARECHFRFTGEAPGARPGRDGLNQSAWHGELLACDDRAPKLGWPA